MLAIAGGILLAVFVLAFLPEVLRAIFAAIILAPLVIGFGLFALFKILQ